MERPAPTAPTRAGARADGDPAGAAGARGRDAAAFMADLTEALHALTEPDEITATAARALGTRLGADRCAYADVEEDQDHFVIAGDYTRGDMPHIVGRFAMGAFGAEALRLMRANRPYVVHDVDADPRVGAEERAAYRATGIVAVVSVPLHRDGRFVAGMAVHQRTPRRWSEEAVDLVRTVVHRSWESAERARAVRRLRDSEARFRAVFDAIDQGYCLCEMVLDDGGRPIDYRFLEVNPLFEGMTGLEDVTGRTALELVPDLEPHWIETYARVALEREPLRFESGSDAMGRWFDVWAGPVEPRGCFALVFTDVTVRRRAEEALRASKAAERRARERAEVLAELTGTLDESESLAARAQRLVEVLVPAVADHAVLEANGRVQPLLAAAHGDGAASGGTDAPAGRALPDPPGVDGAGDGEAVRPRFGGHSSLRVALDLGADATAALLLVRSDPARPAFGEDDAAFADEMAGRVGIALTGARLRDEERHIALQLQQALLPARVLRRCDVSIGARYRAGDDVLEVGGDWYDTIELPDGRVALTVGDVVGHGIEAATAMGRLRTALAALVPHADGPAWLLSRLDEFAAGPDGVDFATACIALLDPATGRLRYASAGHPPMLLVTPGRGSRWLDDAPSRPLCNLPPRERPEGEAVLEPGALLVLYSDGLVERRGERLSEGLARLRGIAEAHGDAPVEDLCERLIRELTAHSPSDDDMVVLCARRTLATGRGFRHAGPARPESLRDLRAALGRWLDGRTTGQRARRDLLLAVGEAASNAVEHAYDGRGDGRVEVEVEEEGDALRVRVRDFGAWRPEAGLADRGRGLTLIGLVTRDLQVERGAGGTTVSFRVGGGPAGRRG